MGSIVAPSEGAADFEKAAVQRPKKSAASATLGEMTPRWMLLGVLVLRVSTCLLGPQDAGTAVHRVIEMYVNKAPSFLRDFPIRGKSLRQGLHQR
jgi:hypothetical protein